MASWNTSSSLYGNIVTTLPQHVCLLCQYQLPPPPPPSPPVLHRTILSRQVSFNVCCSTECVLYPNLNIPPSLLSPPPFHAPSLLGEPPSVSQSRSLVPTALLSPPPSPSPQCVPCGLLTTALLSPPPPPPPSVYLVATCQLLCYDCDTRGDDRCADVQCHLCLGAGFLEVFP